MSNPRTPKAIAHAVANELGVNPAGMTLGDLVKQCLREYGVDDQGSLPLNIGALKEIALELGVSMSDLPPPPSDGSARASSTTELEKPTDKRIPNSAYVIAAGASTTSSGVSGVYNGYSYHTRNELVKIKLTSGAVGRERMAVEFSIYQKLHRDRQGSRYIVVLKDYIKDVDLFGDGVLYSMLVLELGRGDLSEALHRPLSDHDKTKFAFEVAQVVRYLHQHGLVWTDLKVIYLYWISVHNICLTCVFLCVWASASACVCLSECVPLLYQ